MFIWADVLLELLTGPNFSLNDPTDPKISTLMSFHVHASG